MVGLDGARRDEHVTPLREGVPEMELELADLVPAHPEAGEIVPLDQPPRAPTAPPERVPEPGGVFQRCRERREADAGEARQLHQARRDRRTTRAIRSIASPSSGSRTTSEIRSNPSPRRPK